MKKIILLFFALFTINCNYPEMVRNEIIYENDFEINTENINGGGLVLFNKTTVLGNFNNDGFILNLDNTGEHDYIEISFDLYIHGTWDGNFNGFKENDKPDLWTIEFNPDMNLYTDTSNNKFSTTFSNSPCFSNYCLRQSYPSEYPFENNPKTGSHATNLENICNNNFFGGKTTLYKIQKIFKSSGEAFIIRLYDNLYQPNAIDKDGVSQMKCDESWSIDNISVRAINYR